MQIKKIPQTLPLPQESKERPLKNTAAMNCKNTNFQKLDLKLNLSPPGMNLPVQSQTLSSTSTPSSCASSSETKQEDLHFSNSPDAEPMTLVGCRNCMIYIFVQKRNLRCPKCKTTDLIQDFTVNRSKSTSTTSTTTTKKHPGNQGYEESQFY